VRETEGGDDGIPAASDLFFGVKGGYEGGYEGGSEAEVILTPRKFMIDSENCFYQKGVFK
jgi:hypothetical protein